MAEILEIESLFSQALGDSGVDALLEEFGTTTTKTTETPAQEEQAKKPKASLPSRRPRAPNWYIPLPRAHFKYITKATLSQVLRDKVNLLQRHTSLSDNFYFDRWVTKSRLRLRHRADRTQLASLHVHRPDESTVDSGLGLEDIQTHLEQRQQEEENKLSQDDSVENKEESDDEKQGDEEEKNGRHIKMLGRFVHNSLRRGRGLATWTQKKSSTDAPTPDAPDILPPGVAPKQLGLFDIDSKAVSRRFVEEGFEILIKAQDDLLMIDALPKLPLTPPIEDEINSTFYELRLDTQDTQMSEVTMLAKGLHDPDAEVEVPKSSIVTERITYSQLFTLHSKLRESLQRVMDEFLELLDIQYTVQHIFGTVNALHLNGMEYSLEYLTLSPVRDAIISLQIGLEVPLSALTFYLPDINLEPIITILDNCQFTVFAGFDTRFLNLMLPLQRTRLLFAKALKITQQANLPHFNRILGFILEFLPQFMSLDENELSQTLAVTVPVTQLEYFPTQTERKAMSSVIAGLNKKTATASVEKVNKQVPEGADNNDAEQNSVDDDDDDDDEEQQEPVEIEVNQESPEVDGNEAGEPLIVPFCLFESKYLPYVQLHTQTASAAANTTKRELAKSLNIAIQNADQLIVQRSAQQINRFLMAQFELPAIHLGPYLPENHANTIALDPINGQKRIDEFNPQKFNLELERLGVFFALLRDGLFGALFRSFLFVIEEFNRKLPALDAQQAQLLGEITQLVRYKDVLLTYGRSIQNLIRSLNNFSTVTDLYNAPLPLPPTREQLDTLLQSTQQISPEMLITAPISSPEGLETMGLGSVEELNKLDKAQLRQLLQSKLSEKVRTVFDIFQMKQHKEALDMKQRDEQQVTGQIALLRATLQKLSQALVMPTLMPLVFLFPKPTLPQNDNDNNNNDTGSQSTIDTIRQQNPLWWLFVGLKTVNEYVTSHFGHLNQEMLFNKYYTFRSGGGASLWNSVFNTDPASRFKISSKKKLNCSRFEHDYTHFLKDFQELPRQYRNIHFGAGGRLPRTRKYTQQLLVLYDEAREQFKKRLETAVKHHKHEVKLAEGTIEKVRHDFNYPLPPIVANFLQYAQHSPPLAERLFKNSPFTTIVETVVASLTLLGVTLPQTEFNIPIFDAIRPILTFWLHVQKSIYIDHAKLATITPDQKSHSYPHHDTTMIPWYNMLSSLPYFNHFQRFVPIEEFENVHQQCDTVANIYSHLAQSTKEFCAFCAIQPLYFFDHLATIELRAEELSEQGQFPNSKLKPQNQPATIAPGQWGERQLQRQREEAEKMKNDPPRQTFVNPQQHPHAQFSSFGFPPPPQPQNQPYAPNHHHRHNNNNNNNNNNNYNNRNHNHYQQQQQYSPNHHQHAPNHAPNNHQRNRQHNPRHSNNNNNNQNQHQHQHQHQRHHHQPREATPSLPGLNPVQAQPVQAQPIQAQPVQAQPVQAQPVQAQPVQAQPVQAQPVQPQEGKSRRAQPRTSGPKHK